MTRLRSTALLLLLLPLAACTPVEPAGNDSGPKEQQAPPAEKTLSYAGEWKRTDSGAVFKVQDDGVAVTGKLRKGTWMWSEEGSKPEELFDRFEFKLERAGGDALEGAATFRFPGEETDFQSKWKVRLEGEQLKADVEELVFADDGTVESRSVVTKTFAFEPAIPPAPPTVAHGASDQGGFQGSLSALVRAPGRVPLGEGVEIGFRVEVETQAAGQVMKHFLAVVGEEGNHWRLESSQGLSSYGAGAKDAVLGLVVEKEGGKVTRAVIGKKGEKGEAVQILPAGAATGLDEGTQEDVETPAGTFPATLHVFKAGDKAYKSWVGREGDVEGVLLKFQGPDGNGKALEAQPEVQSLDLGETVEARRCRYDNGDEIWHSSDEVVKALNGGMVRSKTSGVVVEVKAITSKAEPTLAWD